MRNFFAGVLAIVSGALILPECVLADLSSVEKLEEYGVEELWSVLGSRLEKEEVEGGPVLRWFLEPGQTGELKMKPEHALFGRLRYYGRLEFEFRIVSGRLDNLELRARDHVSGIRRYRVHQWGLAVMTTESGVWHHRQLDLARPSWLPWDDPDGTPPQFLFSALAVEPGTVLELRRVRLMAEPVEVKPFFEPPITWPLRTDEADGSMVYTLKIPVLNTSGRPTVIQATLNSHHEKFEVSIEPQEVKTNNGGKAEFTVRARMSKADIAATPELYSETLRIGFHAENDPEAVSVFEMPVTRPLSPGIRRQFVISEPELKFLREKLAAGDDQVRKAVGADKIIEEADKFLGIRLEHIPTGRQHPTNNWPMVPGTKPPRRYEIGAFMPEIVDPVTGHRENGTELAGAVWKEYLGNSGQITEKLGLAYALTGDEKYAAKAVELMMLYAQQYGGIDLKNNIAAPPWDGGPAMLSAARTAAGSTYGTNWLFRLHMRMLGLIGDSPSLTPEARKKIYEGFVLPYATELAKFPGGISNMTDISNTNLLILGLVFDDANLVRWALHTDSGLITRLRDIDDDGFSSEGRPLNYHLAAMNEYLPAIGYVLNSGLKVEIPKQRLLAAVRMPYQRAALSGVVPNAGDCGRGSAFSGSSAQADLLVPVFPEEPWLLKIGRGSTLSAKIRSLMSGVGPQQDGYRQLLETKPRLFRDAGLAILRAGDTPETQMMATLDYGRNPMHAHLDRNQITLSAFGKVFTHGPGTLYNVGSGGMTRVNDPQLESFCGPGSLGQNVILVDEKNQRPAIGHLLAWSDTPSNQYAVAQVDGIAPGVSHTRSLILREGVVIVVDRLISEEEHTFDFVYHNLGELSLGPGWTSSPAEKPLAETANYSNIKDLARLSGSGPVRLSWNLTDQIADPAKASPPPSPIHLALWQLPVAGSEVFTGITGMNNPNTAKIPDAAPTLLTRTRGKSATFVTVLEPYKDSPTITGIEGNQEALTLHRKSGSLTIPLKDFYAK